MTQLITYDKLRVILQSRKTMNPDKLGITSPTPQLITYNIISRDKLIFKKVTPRYRAINHEQTLFPEGLVQTSVDLSGAQDERIALAELREYRDEVRAELRASAVRGAVPRKIGVNLVNEDYTDIRRVRVE